MLANRSTAADTTEPPETTRDTLLHGRVVLWQPASGYRVAIDPVLLAASVRVGAGTQTLDIGCGVGAVALCLLARLPDLMITGIESDPHLADLARRNGAENGVSHRFRVLCGAVAAIPEILPKGSFDLVVINPPYLTAAQASPSPVAGKRHANQEGDTPLSAWIGAAERVLRRKGRLALIHRADRIADILAILGDRFGAVVLHPLWPKAGVPAKRVILHACKGVATPLCLEAGTVLHASDGSFTEAAAQILNGSGGPADPPPLF